jgi:hypothetical protein
MSLEPLCPQPAAWHIPRMASQSDRAEPLFRWLQAHLAIGVSPWDRANAYGPAGRAVAPDALQVPGGRRGYPRGRCHQASAGPPTGGMDPHGWRPNVGGRG